MLETVNAKQTNREVTMVGILIKTMTIKGLYIGIIKDFIIDYDDNVVTVGVAWNDNDNTEVLCE